jgi:phage baseplate assembly protein W
MVQTMRFPFQVSARGVVSASSRDDAIRQQLEQLLFTRPGERVNRPLFGCGVQRLVFAGGSADTVKAAEYVIATAIRTHMRDRVTLDAVRVRVDDATLFIDILYTAVESGAEMAASFAQPADGPP